MIQPPVSMAELPGRVRLFPLSGTILLPRAVLPLNIFEPRYLAMVRDAMAGDRLIGMVQPVTGLPEKRPELYDVGSIGRITQFSETGDGRYLISLTGIARFRIVAELPVTTPYRQAEVDHAAFAADWEPAAPLAAPARAALEQALRDYLDRLDLSADWDAVKSADDESLVNTLSLVCPFQPAERQALLEAPALADRTETLTTLMQFAPGPDQDETLQ